MKFSLFLLGSWTDPETSAQQRIFGEMLEQIQYAEELGFDAVWIPEHHSSRYGICPSLMPFVSHVAARTSTIRIGTGISVLPFYNPIYLAEESAMMDILSNGRLNFGVGRGNTVYEYGNFGIDFESRDTRFREVLDIVQGLWTTPHFSYHGELYQVDDITIAPSPLQQPHPPIYAAVSRTPASVDLAVDRGLPILTSFVPPEEYVLGLISLYAERCQAQGKPPRLEEVPYFRFVYLSEDERDAREYPRKSMTWAQELGSYRRTLTRGDEIHVDLDHYRTIRADPPTSYETQLENAYFMTPDRCVDKLRWLEREHNIQHFGACMSVGYMKHDKVLRSMELFAREVMPEFR
jgi:alkanesulfonate monooxygenase SsuD/methylene tetrahydromethanopterin reductase-like flavin-dependent oxidoreductase (luciferase family)